MMKDVVNIVQATLQHEQKEVSRSLSPHIQSQLRPGYQMAWMEIGIGSVARQKAVFHNFIDKERLTLFSGGSDVLLEKLAQVAQSIGRALDVELSELARKVEVAMAVLWESTKQTPAQITYRAAAMSQIVEVIHQVQYWSAAERMRPDRATVVAE